MSMPLVIFAIFAVVILWLTMRSVILWYLKLNRILATLESIDLSLSLLPAVRDERIRMNKIPRKAA